MQVLNSTRYTEITDSKIRMANVLLKANIPTPTTLCMPKGHCNNTFHEIQETLGNPPYVFKPDYGTRGIGVQFALSLNNIESFAKQLLTQQRQAKATLHHHQAQQGFIVQKFIGDPNELISHYRVLVIGNEVFPMTLKVTATSTLTVSNVFSGAKITFTKTTDALKEIALAATQASGLNVAGVDIMQDGKKNEKHYWVLEVNDGPGTKTFEQAGFNVSTRIVNYFIESLDAL